MNTNALKWALMKRNITQKELASRMGVSENTVCNWISGRTDMTLKKASELCNVVGITDSEEKMNIFLR